jgi:hypothetical protein
MVLPVWFSNDLLRGVETASWINAVWLARSAAFTYVLVLVLVRSRLPWFPPHPQGFLMTLAWTMDQVWFSPFLGWAAKY